MTDSSFDVSEIRGHASRISTLADTAKQSVAATVAAVQHADSWGSDAIGRAFDSVYAGPAVQVIDQLLKLGPQVGQVGLLLAGSADRYAGTEADNTTAAGHAGGGTTPPGPSVQPAVVTGNPQGVGSVSPTAATDPAVNA